MTSIRFFFVNRFSRYRVPLGSRPVAQPWFGIGPVWDNPLDQRIIGVSVQIGRHGFAIHRGLL